MDVARFAKADVVPAVHDGADEDPDEAGHLQGRGVGVQDEVLGPADDDRREVAHDDERVDGDVAKGLSRGGVCVCVCVCVGCVVMRGCV